MFLKCIWVRVHVTNLRLSFSLLLVFVLEIILYLSLVFVWDQVEIVLVISSICSCQDAPFIYKTYLFVVLIKVALKISIFEKVR